MGNEELDLWGKVTETKGSASAVLSIIKNQAALLEEKTNGKVKADFTKVRYEFRSKQSYMATIRDLLTTMSVLVGPATASSEELIEVDERKDLEDANSLYEQGKYKFEIYSSKYRFRVFFVEYSSVFPIKIEVEYGILEDKIVKSTIKSVDELISLLRSIFNSNKLKFIIQEMMKTDA